MTIRRLCVPEQSLPMSALRAYRDGCEVIHLLNSGSQYPEMEQIGPSARYIMQDGSIISRLEQAERQHT